MAKVALPPAKREPGAPRAPRAIPPRVTLYKDGIAKLSSSAHALLNGSEHVGLLHDNRNPRIIYISATDGFKHRLSKHGSFSAAPLWRHAGQNTRPLHIPLTLDED